MKRPVITIVSILAVLGLCVTQPFAQTIPDALPVSVKGKKIAVLVDNQYQVGEAYYTPLRLKEAGADVKIVSHDGPEIYRYTPEFTHTMKTDTTPKEALGTKWDGVVVIGGFSPLAMREDPDVIKIIQDVNARKGLVSAICHGVCVLVTADLIRGKNVTGNLPRSIEFSNAGAIFHETAPQVDGNLVTAIGPQDNGPYLDAILNWLSGGEEAAKTHQNDQYLKNKKIAIVIDNRFEFSQVDYPKTRLRQNGASVYIIGEKAIEYSEYRNVQGSIKADVSAQDAASEQYDAVILVGHWAADTYRRSADVRQFVSKQLQRGTIIASVNWGHTVFIQGNMAKGYAFATTWGMQNDITNAGGKAVLAPIHRDRNLITCASDEDMPLLMRVLVNALVAEK